MNKTRFLIQNCNQTRLDFIDSQFNKLIVHHFTPSMASAAHGRNFRLALELALLAI